MALPHRRLDAQVLHGRRALNANSGPRLPPESRPNRAGEAIGISEAWERERDWVRLLCDRVINVCVQ
jgi:hypothetical protein